jgi:hypothetical protein
MREIPSRKPGELERLVYPVIAYPGPKFASNITVDLGSRPLSQVARPGIDLYRKLDPNNEVNYVLVDGVWPVIVKDGDT